MTYPAGHQQQQQPPLPQYEMNQYPTGNSQYPTADQYPQASQYGGGGNQYGGNQYGNGGGGHHHQQQQQYQGHHHGQPHVVHVHQQQAPPPQHHHQHQQQQHHHQPYQGGVHSFGSNPKYANESKMYDQSSIDALVVQGDPVYDEAEIQKYPELKKFRKTGYNDVWAALLFLISFFATIVVAIINGSNGKVDFSTSSSSTVDGEPIAVSLVKGLGVGVACSIFFCVTLLFLMRAAPKGFIIVANVLMVLLWAAFAIWGFMIGDTYMGVIGLIIAGLLGLWLYCVRNMIEFSALMLECSTHVVLNQFGAVGYSFIALVVAIGYYVAWCCMIVPTLDKFNNNEDTSTASGLSIVFLFMVFWAFQVFYNVAHVTSGGVMATWYFIGEHAMPAGAASASFVRAITTSFGSICFGSAIIAILKTIEYIVRSALQNNRNSFAACIAICIIQCIESLARYFNRIAFSFIAIFGIDYIESAKMTWQFVIEGSVWGTLINDILLERVFILANVAQTAVSAVIVWFVFKNWVALVGAILISLGTGTIIFNVVDSGSVTLMVASAVCPEVFAQQHPELRQKLMRAINELQRGGGCCNGGDDDGY